MVMAQQSGRCDLRVNEYTAFCNGPGDVKSPRVMSRRRAHASVRGRRRGRHTVLSEGTVSLSRYAWSSDDGHWPCNGLKAKFLQEINKSFRLARDLRLLHDLAPPIHNTNAREFQRDVDSCIVFHGCPPSQMPGADSTS